MNGQAESSVEGTPAGLRCSDLSSSFIRWHPAELAQLKPHGTEHFSATNSGKMVCFSTGTTSCCKNVSQLRAERL